MPKGMLRWHLKNRLAMMRVHRGFTQAQLAKRLGVSKSQVANWEMDINRPANDDTVDRLARILQCRPHDIFPFE